MRKRILYVVTEFDPFLQCSPLASIAQRVAQQTAANKYEVRVIMPRFGVINERIHRVHNVQRLYGINVALAAERLSLVVKVAPMQKERVQVYFIDNEVVFPPKEAPFYVQDEVLASQDCLRMAFICKSVWKVLDHLGWLPDIIHCMGWPWALVPMYGKLCYRGMCRKTRFVHTYGAQYASGYLDARMAQHAVMADCVTRIENALGDRVDFAKLASLVATYADQVTYSFSEQENQVRSDMERIGARAIPDDGDLVSHYHAIYQELLPAV